MLGLGANEPDLTGEERRWRREMRSAWLRGVVFLILVATLSVAKQHDSLYAHANLIVSYGLVTLLVLAHAYARRGPYWLSTASVVVDVILVVVLFHEHLLASNTGFDHSLTAPALAVAFLLLTQVALRLEPKLVLLFSGLVIFGWLSLLATAIAGHSRAELMLENDWSVFWTEGALATAFGFAAFVCWLLTNDHSVLLEEALQSERRRRNLARFFSPSVLSELQSTEVSLKLSRRPAAVMFVDLRSFTRFSEEAPPEKVASLLAEYRELVTEAVFANGGMIDKFIGDGVMAAFGQPNTSVDDAARALQCALQLRKTLARWKAERSRRGESVLDAGIGLHVGTVMGGILESGSHDEFTLFGDAVNIAQRLERLSNSLQASLVISEEVAAYMQGQHENVQWIWQDSVALEGRRGRIRIAYLPRVAWL
jgi:adenylate cyclase